MAVYKRGKTWWYEFTYMGRRIREGADTSRKSLAIEAEKRRRLELERASVGLPSETAGERIRRVSEVLKEYRIAYAVNHRGKSLLVVENRSVHLNRIVGSVLLADFNQAKAVEYMAARQKESASGRTINMELQVLSRAIGYTWKALWPKLKKLEENHDVGRALEASEEQALLDAASRNTSRLIYPYLYTLAWTGMRSDEARMLRWSQVSFESAEIVVGKAKTEKGSRRRIPMSANLKAVLAQHAHLMADKLGPIQPEWFVFPFSRTKKPVDPTRPATSLKTAWATVKSEAEVTCRLHDLRHSFCTKLAEAGVPESTMLDIMGHMSTAMLRHYSHIRAHARREAIDALESRQFSGGVPTKVPTVSVVSEKASTATH